MTTTDKRFTKFKPKDYLEYYYSRIDDENHSLLEFFAQAYKDVKSGSVMLEFGGGPTIYQIISAANKVAKIDFSDYLQPNLDEVQAWKTGSAGAFDWKPFIKKALEIEGSPSDDQSVTAREELIKGKLNDFIKADAFKSDPCGAESRGKYDVVGVSFVPEGITDSKDIWRSSIANIATLLKPGGIMAMAAITGADFWHSGPQTLPAVNLSADDFKQDLPKAGLSIKDLRIITSEIPDPNHPDFTGYTGMIFIKVAKA